MLLSAIVPFIVRPPKAEAPAAEEEAARGPSRFQREPAAARSECVGTRS